LNSDSWQKIRKTAANAYLGHMLKSFEFYIPKEAVHAWLVAMIILLGIGVLTLDRYDAWRVLIPIALGWFLLSAFLLGYRGEHL
jgi:hypothetical protein